MRLKNIKTASLSIVLSALMFISGCQKRESDLTELPELPDYTEHFTLGKYKDLTYDIQTDYNIKEEDISYVMNYILSDAMVVTEVTDRGAEIGDQVVIRYKGTIDDEEFAGGTTSDEGASIILGSAGYIDGFEDQIVGMMVNETKNINVTFPKDYGKTQLNGKDAVFEVTVLSIAAVSMPEITDELVANNTAYETVDALRSAIENDLSNQIQSSKNAEIYNNLISQIIESSTFVSYPEGVIENMVESSVFEVQQQALFSNVTSDEYVQNKYGIKNINEYESKVTEQATKYIQIKMIICEIARRENITVPIDTFNTYRTTFARQHNFINLNDLNKHYDDADILIECLESYVGEWLVENSTERTN